MVSSYNFARGNLKSFAQKTFEFPVRLDEVLITSAAVTSQICSIYPFNVIGNLRFSFLLSPEKKK